MRENRIEIRIKYYIDIPNLSEDEDAADESDGWDEMETNGEQTTCLFRALQFRTIAVALDHCRSEHNFDLLDLKMKYNMDCYSFIKMINYIRQHKPDPKTLINSFITNPIIITRIFQCSRNNSYSKGVPVIRYIVLPLLACTEIFHC